MKIYFSLLLFLTLALTNCGPKNFLYVDDSTIARRDQNFPVKSIMGSTQVDMVWVIDNSGSMGDYQQEVILNAGTFMSEFIKQGVNWKLGLLSTDNGDKPYTGFAGATPLDSTVADPVKVFTTAVQTLGTYGAASEETFTPILNALKRDSTFIRPNTPTVFIMVTDAEEQSSMNAQQFIQQLGNHLQGRKSYAYGVFASADLGCSSSEGSWNYAGSPYEFFIQSMTAGKVFPICRDFGVALADIGHDIVTRITRSALYLTKRPDLTTLKVYYQGEELKAGLKEEGGFWLYDYRLNAIVFHSLDFAKNDNDSVRVVFEEGAGT